MKIAQLLGLIPNQTPLSQGNKLSERQGFGVIEQKRAFFDVLSACNWPILKAVWIEPSAVIIVISLKVPHLLGRVKFALLFRWGNAQ